MQLLFPDIKPYARHDLKVDDIHTLYIEECGEPTGVPILYVHGGPGAGCSKQDRRYFDPEKYRIILFDQRGAGRSKPHAELENNTTAHLVEDMEAIRKHLGVDKWVLFGGSWGSTLSLLYAQSFPNNVSGMILRGIFLSREEDLRWFYRDGAHQIFPDYWEDFVKPIPEGEREDMISAYYKLLTGDNELAKMSAAKSWSLWEGRCATLRPSPEVVSSFSDTHMAVSLARIEAHYFMNKSYLEPNQILDNAHLLEGIPGTIVHGRYDMICPLENAFVLHQKWPGSELHIVRDAGHSSHEPSIIDALTKATHDMALLICGEGDHLS